ncbi:MAG TPA: hypothetical protein VKU41_23425 [Polyangiaceae bacterium]|nr:hypothetical protein [Polyangiaceae bacterium]
MDKSERVPRGDEVRERVEHVTMALDDQPQLDADMVDGVTQAMLALLVATLGRQLNPLGAYRHPDEVDEVACNDEAPAGARRRDRPIVSDQLDEILVDAARTGNRMAEVVQVAPEVHVG